MASVSRSLLTAAAASRSMAGRTRPLAHKTLNPLLVSSSSRSFPSITRYFHFKVCSFTQCFTCRNFFAIFLVNFYYFWILINLYLLPFSLLVLCFSLGLFRLWLMWSLWCHSTPPSLRLGWSPKLPSTLIAGAGFLKVRLFSISFFALFF